MGPTLNVHNVHENDKPEKSIFSSMASIILIELQNDSNDFWDVMLKLKFRYHIQIFVM